MKWIAFCFLLLILSLSGFAQTVVVKGKIVDAKTAEPLGMSSVVAVSLADSSLVGAAADFDGLFTLNLKSAGEYEIRFSYLGYKSTAKRVFVPAEGLTLDDFSLQKDEGLLKEITIEDKMIMATQLGDTTQFNAGAFKTNPDANAEDLVQKMPGVTVQDGKVQAQGEDVKQILIDGKPFFGTDVNAALKTLPADVIDKVQVFDQQSEQSRFSGVDDGNTTKTINIVTKKDMRDGVFGRVSAAYGYQDRFAAGGNFNYFDGDRRVTVVYQSNNINQQNFSSEDLLGVTSGNANRGGGSRGGGGGGGGRPGGGGGNASDFLVSLKNGITTTHAAGINYSDKWGKKIKVTGSYFFNWGNTRSDQSLFRNFLLTGDSGQVYNENSDALALNINHRFNFRFEYAIDSFNIITVRPRFTIQQNRGNSLFEGQTERGNVLQNLTNSDFSSNLLALNFSNEIDYRHRFAKPGRTLSISLNTGYSYNDGLSSLQAQNNYYSGAEISDTLDQNGSLFGRGYSLGTNWVFTEQIKKGHSLNFSYGASYRNDISNKETFDFVSQTQSYSRIDSLLSNNIRSDYQTQSAGMGYRFNSPKAMFVLNVRYQWSQLNNENRFPDNSRFSKDFHNVLPFAMFRYDITKQKNIRIRYRANAGIPSVDRFQSVINNSNPLILSSGNPDLRQDYSHTLFLRYSATNTVKSHAFFFLISGTATQNFIANSTVIASNDTLLSEGVFLPSGAQYAKPVNLNGYYNLRAFVTYGLPLNFMKCNLNLSAGATYIRTPGLINNELNFSNSPSGNLGISISSNISKKIDFTVGTTSSITFVQNSLRKNLNSNFFNQNTKARLYWDVWKGIIIGTELTHQLFTGLSDGFNQNYFLWNVSLAKKFLKNDAAEFKFTAFDVLNQNNSITRNVTDIYTEDVETVVLNRYFMLSFTYTFKQFKKK